MILLTAGNIAHI